MTLGVKGAGKSDVVNKSCVTRKWLSDRNLPSELFGKFPMESRTGSDSVTQFTFRLRKINEDVIEVNSK